MMITRLKTVPWMWVVMTMLPWSFGIFVSCAFGTITTFELRKFTDSPLLIMIILTVPSVLGVTITPITLYISDHIWTRWGRRKPLIVMGSLPAILAILAIPYAHGLLPLTLLLVAYHGCNAVASTFEPLTQEIVPPSQRGRASIVHTLAIQFAVLSFFWLMLGRFDDVYTQWPWSLFGGITGERLSFWIMALMSLSLFLLSTLGIKEMPPPHRQSLRQSMGGHFTLWRFLKRFFVDVFKLQFLSIYFLSFAGALYGLGIGGLSSLMYTEQFGYAKQQMGDNVAIGMVVMIPITFLTGFMADKYNKLRVYQVCIIGAVITTTVYYCFVMFGLPDHRPSLFQMFIFGEIGAVIGQLAGTVTYPLIYEYIPRDQMGAAAAGLALLRSGFGVILGGVAGLWITGYSSLFMPHAGSEAMAVFQHPLTQQQVVQTLADANHRDPTRFFALAPNKTHQKAWFPPGEYVAASRAWVLRSANPEAAKLKAQRDDWEAQRAPLQGEIDAAQKAGRAPDQAKIDRCAKLRDQVRHADDELDRATTEFRTQIAAAFDGELMSTGQQINSVSGQDHAITLRVQTVSKPAEWQLAEIKKQLNAKAYLSDLTVTAGPESVLNISAKFRTFPTQAPKLDPAVAARLTLPDAPPAAAPALPTPLTIGAETLYQDLVKIGPGIRLFVAEPFPRASFAPQQHDYFSGHLLTIGGGLAALGITLLISRLERRGLVKRLGILEDTQRQALPETPPAEVVSQEVPS